MLTSPWTTGPLERFPISTVGRSTSSPKRSKGWAGRLWDVSKVLGEKERGGRTAGAEGESGEEEEGLEGRQPLGIG